MYNLITVSVSLFIFCATWALQQPGEEDRERDKQREGQECGERRPITMHHRVPPETASACVYSAASFIHVQVITKSKAAALKQKEKWWSLNGDGALLVNGGEKNGNEAGSRRGVKSWLGC